AARCRMRVQAPPLVVLAPAGLLNAFQYSRTGRGTCDDRARRTHRPAGGAHPQRPSSPPQAVLRDARDRRAGLRDPGDRGEAREEDPAEEGDGIGRGVSNVAESNAFKTGYSLRLPRDGGLPYAACRATCSSVRHTATAR